MRALPLLALFISTSIYACPNLSGAYKACKSLSGETTEGVTFSQSNINGITIYHTSSIKSETGETETDEITADGLMRSETDEDGYRSDSKAYCQGDLLILEGTFEQGKISGRTYAETKKEGGKLITKVSATVAGQQFQDTMICE